MLIKNSGRTVYPPPPDGIDALWAKQTKRFKMYNIVGLRAVTLFCKACRGFICTKSE
jgi:hypothetical protein